MLVSGHNCKVAASQASEIGGISKLVCDSPAYDKAMAEYSQAFISAVKDYDYIIATSTTSSKTSCHVWRLT